jgi:hypothetical protein
MLARWEYSVLQDSYAPSDLPPCGYERGYRLPHWTDHDSLRPLRGELERFNGPVIEGSGRIPKLERTG